MAASVGIFNVRTDVSACGCTWGCTDTVRESALKVDTGSKMLLPHRGRKPASVLRLAFQSDAISTD